MTPERYKKIKEIFNQAVEVSVLERQDFVFESCGEDSEMRREIERMLIFDADTTDKLESSAFELFTNVNHSKTPEMIGNYKILRELGRGGMGTVYEAVRETKDFTQRVALKVIKRGMDTDAILSRFRREQQILASLGHPSIARFLDGGMTTDGLPFYAMEYVEGKFIDDFCREKNLSIEEKLKLFCEVCAAVQYAHQNLVIHRDLKPKNILVTEDGAPKLLDFGIGKVLTPETAEEIGTATALGMMTPAYASPEQIRGERIGTSSDVYSLGVILYELLTGQKPYKISSQSQIAIERAVLETEPVRPSSAVRKEFKVKNSKLKIQDGNPKSKIRNPKLLRGDMDNIILKSLRKEPENRYMSVGQFSADIQRYLDGLPIVARPHTFSYRAAKFIRRNRLAVTAGFLIFLSLCAGTTVAVWQAFEARQAKIRAEKRFAEVRQLANNVVFKYHDAIAELQGSTAVREMLVKDALEYLDKLSQEAAGDENLQKELARAYLKLGDVQGKIYAANIGDSEGAMKSYTKSITLLEEVIKKKSADNEAKDSLIEAYDNFAFLMLRTGKHENAKEIVEKALGLHNEISQTEQPNQKRTLQLIELFIRLGDVDVGNEQERINGQQNFNVRLNHHPKALPLIEKLVQTEENNSDVVRAATRVNQRIGTDYFWMGNEAAEHNETEKSIEFYRQALNFHQKMFDMAERLFSLDSAGNTNRRYRAIAHLTIAGTLEKNKLTDEALELAKISERMYEEILRSDPKNSETKFDMTEVYRIFSTIYLAQNDFDQAVNFLQKNIALAEEIFKADNKNMEVRGRIVSDYLLLADIFDKSGNLQKAEINRQKARTWKGTVDKSS